MRRPDGMAIVVIVGALAILAMFIVALVGWAKEGLI